MELERFEELVDRDIHGELTQREMAELDAACLANPALRRMREQDRRLAALMRSHGPNRAPSNLASIIMDQIEAESPTLHGFAVPQISRPAAAPRAEERPAPRVERPAEPAPEQRLRLDWEPAARGRSARKKEGAGIFAIFTSSGFRWGFAMAVLGVIAYQAYVVFRQPLQSQSTQVASSDDETLGDLTPVEMETESAEERSLADRIIAAAPEKNQFSRESLQVADDEAVADGKLDGEEIAAAPADAERLDANEAPRAETKAVEPEEGMRKIKKTSESDADQVEVVQAMTARDETSKSEASSAETQIASADEAPSFAVSAPTPDADARADAATTENKSPETTETMVAAAEPTPEPAPALSDEEIQAAARERELAAAEEARIAREAEDARVALERRLAEAEAERDRLRAKLQEEEVASAAKTASEPMDDVSRQIEELRANLSRMSAGQPAADRNGEAKAPEPSAPSPSASSQPVVIAAAPATAPVPMPEVKSFAPPAPVAVDAQAIAAAAETALSSAQVAPVVAMSEPVAVEPAAPKAAPSLDDLDAAAANGERRRRSPITLKTPTQSDGPVPPAAENKDFEVAQARTMVDRPAAPVAAEAPQAGVASEAEQLRRELEARRAARQPIQIATRPDGPAVPAPQSEGMPQPDSERLRQALDQGRKSMAPQNPTDAIRAAAPTPVNPEILDRARQELERREREQIERQGEREIASGDRAKRDPVTMRVRGSAPPPDPDRDRKEMRAGSGRQADTQITPISAPQSKSAKGRLQEIERAIASSGGAILRRSADPDRPGAYKIKVKVNRERLGDLTRALEKAGVRAGKGASRYDITDEQGSTTELTVQLAPE